MGGKAGAGRKRIRRWVTRPGSGEMSQFVLIWEGEPYGSNDVVLCASQIEALGIHVPTDRPILVEFTARVVPEGGSE